MSGQPPIRRILSVNTSDRGGGAEQVAWTLFKAFQRENCESWLAVGNQTTADDQVVPLHASPFVDYSRYCNPHFQQLLQRSKLRDRLHGVEDFCFPYTNRLLALTGNRPDVVLCHNLHGGYFDLSALIALSVQVPFFVVLHDCWLLTGHCAYPVDCGRWQTGCGKCPDLSLPPALEVDGSAFNWLRKKGLMQSLRWFVAAPTQWLLDRARASILAPSMLDGRVIPCPVDPDVFHPANQQKARLDLGLRADESILVFAANRARSNPYKDSETIAKAIEIVAQRMPERPLHFISLGEEAPTRMVGRATFQYLPFLPNPIVARYLQAADVYLHAARAENFGLITAEAQACGTPVVSTAVGGLPEVIVGGETGLLVPPGDANAMAQAVCGLLGNDELRQQLGVNAARRARSLWRSDRVVQMYLDWFKESRQVWDAARVAA